MAAVRHKSSPPEHLVPRATWFEADLRVREQVVAAVADAAAALGGLDVLVHAAGMWLPSTPESLSEDDLEFLLATNVKSTVFANQAAFGHMREHGGAIVNLGSSEGATGNPIAAAYSLTKAAVHGWTRAAARA